MFVFEVYDSTQGLRKMLKKLSKGDVSSILDKYGRIGAQELAQHTPKDTGRTASSWTYSINNTKDGQSIEWYNSHINDGVNIAVIIQYGHGTGTGGYVRGIDYLNPAMRPVFEQIKNDILKEVIGHG